MVKVIVNDSDYMLIEIVHWISKFEFEHMNVDLESIVNAEIELMEKELKEDYPDFHLVYSYPKRNIMAYPQDERYEKAIHNFEDTGNGDMALKVTTLAVKYY